ncbi:MAG: Ger(x)C family spore germination protein [Clostridia bacterium]|nr:Ger(x)C family spore germination protein [Clostridia bacterium]
MKKTICLILMLFYICITLSGCFDAQEVTEWAYVYSIGIEKGTADKLRLTVQVPTMKAAKGGGQSGESQGGQGEVETITIDCPSFYAGVDMINTFLSRQINYMHTKFLVFSESLAREGIDGYINALIRGRQLRREIYFIVTKGSASEFLKENKTAVSSSLTKKQENLMDQSRNTGFFSNVVYGNVLNDAKTPYSQAIAILAAVNKGGKFKEGEGTGGVPVRTGGDYYAGELVRSGGAKVEFMGTAVFDGGKMVGELNGDETRVMMMARDEFRKGFFAIKDPNRPDSVITMNIRRQKSPKIKVFFNEDKATVDVKVFLEGDITAVQSTFDYESGEKKNDLESVVSSLIKSRLDKTIKKCQELNTDVFRFGYNAAVHFATIQEWEEYNWLKNFKDAQVNSEVEFKIRRMGTMLKSSEIYSASDKNDEKGGK